MCIVVVVVTILPWILFLKEVGVVQKSIAMCFLRCSACFWHVAMCLLGWIPGLARWFWVVKRNTSQFKWLMFIIPPNKPFRTCSCLSNHWNESSGWINTLLSRATPIWPNWDGDLEKHQTAPNSGNSNWFDSHPNTEVLTPAGAPASAVRVSFIISSLPMLLSQLMLSSSLLSSVC